MNKTFDRYASVFFALVGAFFVNGSRQIATSAYGSEVGPNIFPLFLGIILILLSIRLFYETFSYKQTQQEKTAVNIKGFVIMLVATFLYAILLEPIGYVISTFLFLTLGFKVMGNKSWWKTLLIALAFSVIVYVVYVKILEGTLPGLPSWLG
ncbi:tripartite tricarboxylate transporter TctB family protein [Brevibacillus fulvus]|uniref:Tricarboxylic transport membrane protein n=1 Tax=Brevibacillus fulvus TaxID=1125967 RepID=A0A939BS86_9BACL|nr:tripartite tricarboxylate transporter TctB family protein [Brevibacillus fulvus]MBM7590447.1 putative tricarboxylic transport membrane protein [Brevibacillus fulvus]